MDSLITELQDEFENYLKELNFPVQPVSLYEPVRYMLSLGGKRIRPVLVLLAADLFGGNRKLAMSAAAGIEVFHNFTLLHDDIMDKAPLRRGQLTVHERWNPNIAILSGDAMFVKSCQLMMNHDSSVMPPVMNLFLKTALEVCEGQQMDMDFEKAAHVSIEDYLEMIRLKTAVLVGASLSIGAALGNGSNEDRQHLYDFGVNLGIAFQLQDDILDVFGNSEKFGKQVGGDILANKKTFLLLNAQLSALGSTKNELEKWLAYSGPDAASKISGVTAVYTALKVREKAEEKMEQLYKKAISHLDLLHISVEKKKPLQNLAAFLMSREN